MCCLRKKCVLEENLPQVNLKTANVVQPASYETDETPISFKATEKINSFTQNSTKSEIIKYSRDKEAHASNIESCKTSEDAKEKTKTILEKAKVFYGIFVPLLVFIYVVCIIIATNV